MRVSALGLIAVLLEVGSAQAAGMTGVININQATEAQLSHVRGIGKVAAKKIIAYRTTHPFLRIEELVNVPGFGRKRFDKLKPYLTTQGPTTLAVQAKSPKGRTAHHPRAAGRRKKHS